MHNNNKKKKSSSVPGRPGYVYKLSPRLGSSPSRSRDRPTHVDVHAPPPQSTSIAIPSRRCDRGIHVVLYAHKHRGYRLFISHPSFIRVAPISFRNLIAKLANPEKKPQVSGPSVNKCPNGRSVSIARGKVATNGCLLFFFFLKFLTENVWRKEVFLFIDKVLANIYNVTTLNDRSTRRSKTYTFLV